MRLGTWWWIVAVVGCSKSEAPGAPAGVVANARIEDGVVVVKVTCTDIREVTLRDQREPCNPETQGLFHVPAAVFGAGKHKLALSAKIDDTVTPVEVAVDIPADAVRPDVVVTGCTAFGDVGRADFEVHTWRPAPLRCGFAPDRGGALTVLAAPGSKLVVGKTNYDVPETGVVEIKLDFNEHFTAMTLGDVKLLTSRAIELEVPWKAELAGKTAEGKLRVDLPGPTEQQFAWLKYMAEPKAVRPTFAPGADRPIVLVTWHQFRESHPGTKFGEELERVLTRSLCPRIR